MREDREGGGGRQRNQGNERPFQLLGFYEKRQGGGFIEKSETGFLEREGVKEAE